MTWEDLVQLVRSILDRLGSTLSFALPWTVSLAVFAVATAAAWGVHAVIVALLPRLSRGRRPYLQLILDYIAPIEAACNKLAEIVAQSKLRNGSVANLQVSDCKETAIQLRALVVADNASAAWDLRCEVRDKLIDFLQREHPYALPRRRYDAAGKTPQLSNEARKFLPSDEH